MVGGGGDRCPEDAAAQGSTGAADRGSRRAGVGGLQAAGAVEYGRGGDGVPIWATGETHAGVQPSARSAAWQMGARRVKVGGLHAAGSIGEGRRFDGIP